MIYRPSDPPCWNCGAQVWQPTNAEGVRNCACCGLSIEDGVIVDA